MGRKVLIAFVILIVLGAIVFLVGPRTPLDTGVTIDAPAISADPEGWIARQEAKVTTIREGLAKEIVWAYPASKAKTPLSIVYIHGFSATKEETRPVADKVAAALGANLYYARLAGHGQDGATLAESSVNDWINDLAEALIIGRALGDKTIVVGASTGGGLVAWAASRQEFSGDMAALVLISPNFAINAAGSFILTLPWAEQLANLIIGPTRSFEPLNELHEKYWTYEYPTKAILPMAALTKMARNAPHQRASVPALFVYSPQDSVVDPAATAAVIERWGGPTTTVLVEDADDPSNHVIAGDALSPSTTDRLSENIISWIKNLNL